MITVHMNWQSVTSSLPVVRHKPVLSMAWPGGSPLQRGSPQVCVDLPAEHRVEHHAEHLRQQHKGLLSSPALKRWRAHWPAVI